MYRDLHETGGALVMLVTVIGMAALVPKAWLRVLLGRAAAGLLCQALLPSWGWSGGRMHMLLVLHGLLAAWLVALWLQERSVALAALIEAMATWLAAKHIGGLGMGGGRHLFGGRRGGL